MDKYVFFAGMALILLVIWGAFLIHPILGFIALLYVGIQVAIVLTPRQRR